MAYKQYSKYWLVTALYVRVKLKTQNFLAGNIDMQM